MAKEGGKSGGWRERYSFSARAGGGTDVLVGEAYPCRSLEVAMQQRMAGEAIARARQERPEVFSRPRAGGGGGGGSDRPAVSPEDVRSRVRPERERMTEGASRARETIRSMGDTIRSRVQERIGQARTAAGGYRDRVRQEVGSAIDRGGDAVREFGDRIRSGAAQYRGVRGSED